MVNNTVIQVKKQKAEKSNAFPVFLFAYTTTSSGTETLFSSVL